MIEGVTFRICSKFTLSTILFIRPHFGGLVRHLCGGLAGLLPPKSRATSK
jgi:hypothetical protein